MADLQLQPFEDRSYSPEPDSRAHFEDDAYSLGSPAAKVYTLLASTNRQMVIEEGRELASITIPSIAPPASYHVGDDLPGTNQSISAGCVNNLASKVVFMAFPPGQPMMRLMPVEQAFTDMIQADPTMYGKMQLALSRVELSHREAAADINLATAWFVYIKLLLVTGNALWKHIKLREPTSHRLDFWVCSRNTAGHPLVTILQQNVRCVTLDRDVRELIYQEHPELLHQEEWSREVLLYYICKLRRNDSDKPDAWSWEYWEETENGTLIPGTEMETDYDDVPMWPGWMIPVEGQNYGRAYAEEYRGDHFLVEANSSALNDGAAQAALMLTFVKPGGSTSLNQVQKARNLSILSGNAADMTTYKSDKGQDLEVIAGNVERAEVRLGKAYLMTSSVMRKGERVTAEEVQRVGQDLDQAMGGLYTQIAQAHQRVMVKRFVHLHNEENPKMPTLPPEFVKLEVVTGVDAMGRSNEVANMSEFAADINTNFPKEATSVLVAQEYATRQAANRGIKPDGLVQDPQVIAAQTQKDQQTALSASVATQSAGPMAGAMGKALAARMPQGPNAQPPLPQAQTPQPPTQGAQQ